MKIRLTQYCRVIKEAVIEVSETEEEIKALLKSGEFWNKYNPKMIDDTSILYTDAYNDDTDEEIYVQD